MDNKTNKERLASIETDMVNVKEDIGEIKESLKDLPRLKTIVGFFSVVISSIVAGVIAFFVKKA